VVEVFHVAEVASRTSSNQEFQYTCIETEFLVSSVKSFDLFTKVGLVFLSLPLSPEGKPANFAEKLEQFVNSVG